MSPFVIPVALGPTWKENLYTLLGERVRNGTAAMTRRLTI